MPADSLDLSDGYRLLAWQVTDPGIVLLNRSGEVLGWNPAAERITGYLAGEVHGRHFGFLYPRDNPSADADLRMAEEQGRHETSGWRGRNDDTRIWASQTLTALRGEDGAIVGYGIVLRDLTSEMQDPPATADGTQPYRSLIDEVQEYAIFTLDAENRITSWNRGAERLMAFTKAEAIGQWGGMIFIPEDRAKGDPEDELRRARAHGWAQNERWHLRRDGSRFWGSGAVMLLQPDGDGAAAPGFVKILRDETRRKRVEDELRSMNERLEQRVGERTAELVANQRKLRWLAVELSRTEQRERQRIAGELHDHLAQTLAVCKMRLAGARAAVSDEKAVRALAELKDLLNQALAYTRSLMSDLSPVIMSQNDLPAAIEWVADKTRRLGLRVTVSDDGRPKPMSTDILPFVFESVRELLSNVVKHASAEEAHVSLQRGSDPALGDVARVVVSDRGNGFGADTLAELEAGHEGNARRGFGLFSIRERANMLGARVEVTSTPGEGTQVVLLAPLAERQRGSNEGAGGVD